MSETPLQDFLFPISVRTGSVERLSTHSLPDCSLLFHSQDSPVLLDSNFLLPLLPILDSCLNPGHFLSLGSPSTTSAFCPPVFGLPVPVWRFPARSHQWEFLWSNMLNRDSCCFAASGFTVYAIWVFHLGRRWAKPCPLLTVSLEENATTWHDPLGRERLCFSPTHKCVRVNSLTQTHTHTKQQTQLAHCCTKVKGLFF